MKDLFASLQEDLDQRRRMAGMKPADLLELPDVERRVVQHLVRNGDTFEDELGPAVGLSPHEVEAALTSLAGKSFVRRATFKGRRLVRTYFAWSRASGAGEDVWSKLASRIPPPGADAP